ncbi:restriction endonuclease subunit S [Aeromonas veronii]|uniref:restriction endonuclease subunit S n=1 Tax=Aeromonas veronii TaxID=654 RepID=UPI003F795CC4
MSEVVATAQQGLAGKYHPYPEYKDSGVEWLGKLPSHWVVTCIKRLSSGAVKSFTDGDWIESPYITDDGVRLIQTGNIGIGKYKEQGYRFIANNTFAQLRCTEVKPNDVLICRLAEPVGRACLAPSLQNRMITSVDVSILKLDKNINERFVVYFLTSSEYLGHLNATGRGGTRQRIARSDLGDVAFALPSIHEQRTIADFLDYETARIDRLIAQQQRLIELLKEKRQAVISQAVTKGLNPNAPMKDSGVEWLGQVPEHWVVTALKRYWGVVDCKHITAEFIDDGIPLASIREVQSWEVDLSNAKQTSEEYYNALIDGGRIPENGDIIYSRNATVGEAARVTAEHPRFAMGQDVCLLKRIRKCIDTDFFMYQLKSRIISYQLDTLMVGSTFKRINVDDIRNFVVVVPPEDEAVAIRSYLNDFDRKYKNIEQSASRQVSLLQERRTALISAAVTGKIDLRGWTPPAEEAAA